MKPEGSTGRVSVSPVLVVDEVEEEAAFLQAVLQAEIGMVIHNAQGEVEHAEARIGDAILVLERASGAFTATRSVTRIPTSSVQAALQLAIDNGGNEVPMQGGVLREQGGAAVTDPQGNIWWIVPQERKPSNEEVQRRLGEQRRQRL